MPRKAPAGPRWWRRRAPCRRSRWHRRSTSSFSPRTAKAPRDWPAVPRSRTVRCPGCSPAMPNFRVILLLILVPMARCVLRMLYCNCIFSPRSNKDCGVADHVRVQRLRYLVAALQRAVAGVRAGIRLDQQRVEVEVVEVFRAAADLLQQVGAANDIGQLADTKGGEDLPHFLGDEAEQVDDLLRRCRRISAAASRPGCRRRPGRCCCGIAAP